jgi:hypothetical protein
MQSILPATQKSEDLSIQPVRFVLAIEKLIRKKKLERVVQEMFRPCFPAKQWWPGVFVLSLME